MDSITGPTRSATSCNDADASGSARITYRFHARPMSWDEMTAVRHCACSFSASGAQIRSDRNSWRLRAASGEDEIACTMVTNALPASCGRDSHCARKPATSRAPGDAGASCTSRMICCGSAGSSSVEA